MSLSLLCLDCVRKSALAVRPSLVDILSLGAQKTVVVVGTKIPTAATAAAQVVRQLEKILHACSSGGTPALVVAEHLREKQLQPLLPLDQILDDTARDGQYIY
jgi:hypothetical protein